MEFFRCIVICVIAFGVRKVQFESIKARMAASSSETVADAIEGVLYGMYDAVVHLDTNIRFKKPARELDALLLRDGVARHHFLSLLSNASDREKFLDFVKLDEEIGVKLPRSMHLTMRDSNGSDVRVQLYHKRFVDSMDQVLHVVGIRESTEAGVSAERFQGPQDDAHLRNPHTAVARAASAGSASSRSRGLAAIQEGTASDLGSSQLGEQEVLPLANGSEYEPGERSVWINTEKEGWPMRKCTPEFFATFGGPSCKAGSQLMKLVPRNDRVKLERKVENVLNDLMVPGSGVGVESTSFPLRLKLPGRSTLIFEARGTLSLTDGNFDMFKLRISIEPRAQRQTRAVDVAPVAIGSISL